MQVPFCPKYQLPLLWTTFVVRTTDEKDQLKQTGRGGVPTSISLINNYCFEGPAGLPLLNFQTSVCLPVLLLIFNLDSRILRNILLAIIPAIEIALTSLKNLDSPSVNDFNKDASLDDLPVVGNSL